jgi:hypothetical protein
LECKSVAATISQLANSSQPAASSQEPAPKTPASQQAAARLQADRQASSQAGAEEQNTGWPKESLEAIRVAPGWEI